MRWGGFVFRSHRWMTRSLAVAAMALLLIAVAACGSGEDGPTASPPASPARSATATETAGAATNTPSPATETAVPGDDPFAGVPGIVDASNHGWPRQVEGMNGVVTIEAQPERIHTTSVGLDEVTLGILAPSRLAAVGTSAQNPEYSNVAGLVADLPAIGRDPEEIAAVEPDLVLASPTQDEDFINALVSIEIPVVQVELLNSPEGRIQTILLLGYIYGEEERALGLAAEVRDRYESLLDITQVTPEEERPVVVYATDYSDTLYAAGSESTEAGILEAAGGRCAPCEAGLVRNEAISLESIIAMNPDVIVIPMPAEPGEAFRDRLLGEAALAEVPAIRDGRVHVVTNNLHTTLSYNNVRGAEQLAAILLPDAFPVEYLEEPPPFSLP